MIKRVAGIGVFCAALLWAQSPALSGIAHVAFRVADVETARAFYQKLGFEQAFEFTREGKTTEAFIKINDRQFIELYPRDSQPTGLMHVCYESSNLEALYAEYVKRELKPPAVRKAGAGNLLLVIHDPENQVIEYTQYMPGSMHFEDHGKHLGGHRISQHLLGATVAVRDLAAGRAFYTGKLAFEPRDGGDGVFLRIPGGSGEEVKLEAAGDDTKPGLFFAVTDVQRAADELRSRGLAVKTSGAAVLVTDPDGAIIVFTGSGAR
ncbi:MAG: VOC family protein [Bryobacteraceae bacterium]|jgi:catechol 2,3-dioxygenase-like lactoylglutathione lyase family enzyme